MTLHAWTKKKSALSIKHERNSSNNKQYQSNLSLINTIFILIHSENNKYEGSSIKNDESTCHQQDLCEINKYKKNAFSSRAENRYFQWIHSDFFSRMK